MKYDRGGTAWAGLGLIGLGIAFLLAQAIGWDKVWPIFPIFGGLAALVGYATSGFKESGLVFVGVGATLVGLFFFGFTFGFWAWDDMGYLWPVFVLIGGVAFIALFLAERKRDWGTLGVGCAAFIVGIAGLAFTFGYVGKDIVKLWPLVLILVGVSILFGAGLQFFGRSSATLPDDQKSGVKNLPDLGPLLVQYSTLGQEQKEPFVREHPELQDREVVGWALAQARACQGREEYETTTHYASAAYDLATGLEEDLLAADAADILADVFAKTGYEQSADEWKATASLLRAG
jgi:hypothetical protein